MWISRRSSNRCGCSLRTRFASWAGSWVFRNIWSCASPSQGPVWPFGLSARSQRRRPTFCAVRTLFSGRKSPPPGWTVPSISTSRYWPICAPWVSWAMAAPTTIRWRFGVSPPPTSWPPIGLASPTRCWTGSACGLSTRWVPSTASSTTSHPSPPLPSSGNDVLAYFIWTIEPNQLFKKQVSSRACLNWHA